MPIEPQATMGPPDWTEPLLDEPSAAPPRVNSALSDAAGMPSRPTRAGRIGSNSAAFFSRWLQARHATGFANDLAKAVLLGVVYYVAAVLSLRMALVGGQVTPIWPPTGIALVGLLYFGRKVWPGVAIAAFFVNAPIGPTLFTAAGVTAGNTLAPLLAVVLLQRMGFRLELDRLRDALAIVFVGALSVTVSATGGSVSLLLSGSVLPSGFWATWFVWWTGDAMGIFLVAPFLLSLRRTGLVVGAGWLRPAEGGLLLAGVAIVAYLAFQSRLHLEYLVFPFLAWAALRFQLRGAAPAALLVSSIAIWAAVNGTGPFADGTLLERMVTLQAFNGTAAFASFVLAAVVAERVQMEGRLVESERRASIGRVAAYIAHEIRTPLTNVALLASTIARRTRDAEILTRVEKINVQRRLAAAIIDNLLALTRTEEPHAVETDLRTVLATASEEVASFVRRGVDFRKETGEIPALAMVDPLRLQQAVANLLKNALEATRKGSVSVRLEERVDEYAIVVQDTGPGIAEPLREKIFEPFFTTKGPDQGTGLGLSFAKAVVEAHHGRIELASEPGRGSTFTIVLPRGPTRA